MKITLTRETKDHQLRISTKTMDRFLERINRDDAKCTIHKYRERVRSVGAHLAETENMKTWLQVNPCAELKKDVNNNIRLKKNTGILLLTFEGITKEEEMEETKKAFTLLPSTYAAIKGADGISIHVWVKYADPNGHLPSEEKNAELLLQAAYRQAAPIYQSLTNAQLSDRIPSLHNHFLMTWDSTPYYYKDAVPLHISNPSQGSMRKEKNVDISSSTDNDIKDMIIHLKSYYELRYNTVMKYTEYLEKEKEWLGFMPVSQRVLKRMTLEVQLADISVSTHDVKNYLESDFIKSYDPIDEYLFECNGKWDGKDHIRALARTVPTDNPRWADWFYTWFLGMVEQWHTYRIHQYGNSVVPLLISKQGYNKSTFCRRLLPPELQWGYNDNIILSEKRQVLQAMSQFLIINLDEFNQFSANLQQGFLKNAIQLPTVKIKRPYGSHVEEFPRTASFIATSNIDDILSDPSGNRRFIGVKLTGPIDVSVKPNHKQLFAQALTALQNGEKCYFDNAQTRLLMESNREFQTEMPLEQCFHECFSITKSEKEGNYMSTAAIFKVLKDRFGSSLEVSNIITLGRRLRNMDGIVYKRACNGTLYLLKKNE